jgi:phosphoserine phosphatase RsbU/P
MKILIVDDDNFSRRVLEAQLQKRDHIVVSCSNGESALETFRKDGTIDLVVLDWMMPGMNGIEVCKKIKADPSRPFVYVIILTAKRDPSDIARALDSGADDFVSKPFDPLEFEARINVGQRTMRLQKAMMEHINELEAAAAQIEQLSKMLPICPLCGTSRNEPQYWEGVKEYVGRHSKAELSDAVCHACEAERKAVADDTLVPVSRR